MITTMQCRLLLAAVALTICAAASPARAAGTPEQVKREIDTAARAANAVTVQGPKDIPFAGQATFHLPQGYGFVPAAESKTLMEAMGNRVGDGFIGLIIPIDDEKSSWFVAASYNNSGYVKDDDAKEWKADEMLSTIRSGTEETNQARKKRGIPEMDILGWVEQPTYVADSHRLVWSIASRNRGEPDSAEQGINYNTLALGREGYISMNMVTDRARVEGLKPVAQTLLAALEFNSGKRYADFNAGTDKVAAYGLAAIVAGVAAKKLGVLAILAAFVAKFAKVIGIAALAGFGGFYNRFKRTKNGSQPAPPSITSTPPAE